MIEIPEEIKKDLELIDAVANDLQMKTYIVGGMPRDIVSGKGITAETDLDLTEKYGNAFDLAFFVTAKYNLPSPVIYDNSGTAMIMMPSKRTVEFHNAYFNVPHIIDQLYLLGVEPTPINKDVYARDFTINTLLLDPENGEIQDITGKGVSDIYDKILRTPLAPEKTLALNPKIILRGIRFKIEMGLKSDDNYENAVMGFAPNLIEWLKEHPDSKMVQVTVNKIMALDPEKGMEEFKKLGILPYLPKTTGIDNAVKSDIFGIDIAPIAKNKDQVKIALGPTSTMSQRLMEEREKHKAYMRRKKHEDLQDAQKKFDIMEKARSGFFSEHSDDPISPDVIKKKRPTGRPGYEFVEKR